VVLLYNHGLLHFNKHRVSWVFEVTMFARALINRTGRYSRPLTTRTVFRNFSSQKKITLGTFASIPSPHVVEIIARYGFEFIVIDCEHGILTMEIAENMVRAANASGITPYLRVPEKNKKMINHGLEIGATRIIVPDIRTPEEVALAVKWTTYGNNGRGAALFTRDSFERRPLSQNWEEFMKKAAENTGIIALVESPDGIRNLKEIVSVPGLKGLIVGPLDLSVSSGWNGNLTHPELIKILEESVEIAMAANVTPIVPLFGGNLESISKQMRKFKKKVSTCSAWGVIRRFWEKARVCTIVF